MKFCKDCRFYRPDVEFLDESKQVKYGKCAAPQNPFSFNTTSGEPHYDNPYCSIHREYGWFLSRLITRCGKSARWFKPKESP